MALGQARFYLRRDIDTNATTLYRLFHEGLAEHLRADPYGPPREGGMSTPNASPYALPVYEGLLQSVPPAGRGRHAWHVADPYLLRHAAQHARNAGRLDELLQDPEYLVHGEPEMVNAVLADARTPPGLLAAAVYRTSYGVHRDLRPEQRRQVLALDATRFRATELSRELARWADWQPVWATGEQVSAELTATLTGHTNWVTGVAAATLDGRPVAITTSADRTARVWDLATGQATATLTGHTGTGTAWRPPPSTAARSPSPPATMAPPGCGTWPPAQATAILTAHTSRVTDVAAATLDGPPGRHHRQQRWHRPGVGPGHRPRPPPPSPATPAPWTAWRPPPWTAARSPSPPAAMAPPGCGTWPPARPPPPSPATPTG